MTPLLNEVDAIFVGNRQAQRAYLGRELVWQGQLDAYKWAVLADNPVAYYRLGETSGNARDEMGGPDGAWSGSYLQAQPSLLPSGEGASGRFGWADTTSALRILDSPATRLDAGPLSVEMWVRWEPGGLVALKRVFVGHTTDTLRLLIETLSGGISALSFTVGGNSAVFPVSPPLQASVSYHLLLTSPGPSQAGRFYVNGVDRGSVPRGSGTTVNTGGLWIGASASGSGWMIGRLQEFALYNYVLSAGQVAAHYQAGSGQ